MRTEIIGIERDIILEYVINEDVPLLVFSRSDIHNQFLLKKGFFKILQKKIIFFTPLALKEYYSDSIIELPFTDIRVRFFYKGRGLYFDSTLKTVKNGFAFTIPSKIKKMAAKIEIKPEGVFASFYYSGIENAPLSCITMSNSPVFTSYSNRIKNNGSEYIQQEVNKFFNSDENLESSVEGQIDPLCILALTNSTILLGIRNNTVQVEQGEIYDMKLIIPAGVVKRQIMLKCEIAKVYKKNIVTYKKYMAVAVCNFCNVKLEDQRFLYEQYFNKKFI